MKGQKTGGRVPGTPNKVTKELRIMLKAAIEGELERIADSLADLTPKERLDIIIRLMPYAMPRVQPIGSHYDHKGIDWGED
jgi:hypothetical protein